MIPCPASSHHGSPVGVGSSVCNGRDFRFGPLMTTAVVAASVNSIRRGVRHRHAYGTEPSCIDPTGIVIQGFAFDGLSLGMGEAEG